MAHGDHAWYTPANGVMLYSPGCNVTDTPVDCVAPQLLLASMLTTTVLGIRLAVLVTVVVVVGMATQLAVFIISVPVHAFVRV
jgi:hypothetical protein